MNTLHLFEMINEILPALSFCRVDFFQHVYFLVFIDTMSADRQGFLLILINRVSRLLSDGVTKIETDNLSTERSDESIMEILFLETHGYH